MARQGKMHGTAFHVESVKYKYAIENENAGYHIKETPINCEYYDIRSKYCKLWNSGHKKCSAYKCKYHNTNLQRAFNCESCAYYIEGQCRNEKKPSSAKDTALTAGKHCSFFLSESDAPDKYQLTHTVLSINFYSKQKDKYEQEIQRCDKMIQKINTWIQEDREGKNTIYYQGKIDARKRKIADSKREIDIINAVLAELKQKLKVIKENI